MSIDPKLSLTCAFTRLDEPIGFARALATFAALCASTSPLVMFCCDVTNAALISEIFSAIHSLSASSEIDSMMLVRRAMILLMRSTALRKNLVFRNISSDMPLPCLFSRYALRYSLPHWLSDPITSVLPCEYAALNSSWACSVRPRQNFPASAGVMTVSMTVWRYSWKNPRSTNSCMSFAGSAASDLMNVRGAM